MSEVKVSVHTDAAKVQEELEILASLLGDASFADAAAEGDYTLLGKLAAKAPPTFQRQIVENFKVQLGLGVSNPVEFRRAADFVGGRAVAEEQRQALAALAAIVEAPVGATVLVSVADFVCVAGLRKEHPDLAPTVEDLVLYALEEADEPTTEAIVRAATGVGAGDYFGNLSKRQPNPSESGLRPLPGAALWATSESGSEGNSREFPQQTSNKSLSTEEKLEELFRAFGDEESNAETVERDE